MISAIERFEEKYVIITETGCWVWTAGCTPGGYSTFRGVNSECTYGHRFSYEYYIGPIPSNLEIDHLCRVRCCVNPDHLEAIPHQINCQRGEVGIAGREKTHCPHGHEYDEENTYIRPDNGFRICRSCRIIRDSNRLT